MVTILVGPQGSGKSTWAKDRVLDRAMGEVTVISQDQMGQKGHMAAYSTALKSQNKDTHHIIVDRINHTREQRRRYVDLAREAGWRTQIIVMNEDWNTCMDRLADRTGHPTIKDKETGIQALRTYFQQYERPASSEADSVVYLSAYDPFLMDLNNVYPAGTRYIVIGDVHGCYDEMMELLEKMEYKRGEDVIVFCGDLIDRLFSSEHLHDAGS